MISRHRVQTGVAVRTEPEVRDAATAALDARGWTMAQFLIACLRAVAAGPDRLLAILLPYRPESRPKGRPRRSPTE